MAHDDRETLPTLPEPGFYYHYKHDPRGSVNNYAYEIFGVGYHTEADCRLVDQYLVSYRPLYPAFVYRLGKGRLHDNRPLNMFMEPVTKEGKVFPRFTKIRDQKVIEKLRLIRKDMYPHLY